MTSSRRSFGLGVAALALLAGCDRIAGVGAKPAFHFTDITGAEFARRLELPDVDGKERSLADWKGKVVVVFFGYTQCPDVCPTTMAELAQIRQLLGADAERLQTVFVTIDPERDTAEIL
jgi:protein SCO1/2